MRITRSREGDLLPETNPRARHPIGVNRAGLLLIGTLLLLSCGKTQSRTLPAPNGLARATFAGGCFWCMEPPFEALEGVVSVTAGYCGPGRREAVQILYDPQRVTYARLLDVFWHNVDPTDDDGQFCDKGAQYRTAIFVHDDEQRRQAEASKAALQKTLRVRTEVLPAGPFDPADEYDQDYSRKHPVRYEFYRLNCGRDDRLDQIWRPAPSPRS